MHIEKNTARPQGWSDRYRDELIQQVQNTRRVSKALLRQDLISEDQYQAIMGAGCSQDRMKLVLELVEENGQRGRDALYRLLQEHEPKLTLCIEQAVVVHALKHRLVQTVKQVESVAQQMLDEGLLEDTEYFQVCEEEEAEERMKAMYRVLEQCGLMPSAGFYTALFHCEPLLHRQLENERVLQVCWETEAPLSSAAELNKRRSELAWNEKAVEQEMKTMRRERETLELIRSEVERERQQVEEMKRDMERWWKAKSEMKEKLET